jgi:hypothetical protein
MMAHIKSHIGEKWQATFAFLLSWKQLHVMLFFIQTIKILAYFCPYILFYIRNSSYTEREIR